MMFKNRYLIITVTICVSVSVLAVTALFMAQPDKADESAGLSQANRSTQMTETHDQKVDNPVALDQSPLQTGGPVSLDWSTFDIAAKTVDLTSGTEIQLIVPGSQDNRVQVLQKAAKLSLPKQSQRTASKQPPEQTLAGQLKVQSKSIEETSVRTRKGPLLRIDTKDIKTLQNTARRNIAKSSTDIKIKTTHKKTPSRPRYARRARRRTNRTGVKPSGNLSGRAVVETPVSYLNIKTTEGRHRENDGAIENRK